MAISNFGWAWKGPQIFQLLPALTFLREASSLLQPAFTFPSVTFHSRCPDGPQRVSPHWLGWCPCPCPRPGVTSGEPTSTLGPAEAVPGRPEAAGSMRREPCTQTGRHQAALALVVTFGIWEQGERPARPRAGPSCPPWPHLRPNQPGPSLPQGEMMATRCPKGSSASKFRSRSKGRLVASWLRTCS